MSALGGPYVEQDPAMYRGRRRSAACIVRSRLRRWRIARRTRAGRGTSNASADRNNFLATVQHAGAIANADRNADRDTAADGHSVTDTFPDTYGCANADALPNSNAAPDLGLTMAAAARPCLRIMISRSPRSEAPVSGSGGGSPQLLQSIPPG